ncbi:hypothetical protein ACFQXA_12400 [Nocardiopsis composta]
MDVQTRRESRSRPRRSTVDRASLVFWTAVVALALIAFLLT